MIRTIEELEAKLKVMREEYKTASPDRKKWLEQGAKLLKNHRHFLASRDRRNMDY